MKTNKASKGKQSNLRRQLGLELHGWKGVGEGWREGEVQTGKRFWYMMMRVERGVSVKMK